MPGYFSKWIKYMVSERYIYLVVHVMVLFYSYNFIDSHHFKDISCSKYGFSRTDIGNVRSASEVGFDRLRD